MFWGRRHRKYRNKVVCYGNPRCKFIIFLKEKRVQWHQIHCDVEIFTPEEWLRYAVSRLWQRGREDLLRIQNSLQRVQIPILAFVRFSVYNIKRLWYKEARYV